MAQKLAETSDRAGVESETASQKIVGTSPKMVGFASEKTGPGQKTRRCESENLRETFGRRLPGNLFVTYLLIVLVVA